MTVISQNPLTLSGDEADLTADHPIVGWDNKVTVDNIYGVQEDAGYPATNAANPATFLKWQSNHIPDNGLGITVTETADFDYAALAGHNLGSIGASCYVGYFDTNSPQVFHQLTDVTLITDDSPIIMRWTKLSLPAGSLVHIQFQIPSGKVLSVAVFYTGKLLYMPRKVYQGLVPPPFGRTAKVSNGKSEQGHFLGRIVTQRWIESSLPLSLIDPTYYRDHIDEFLQQAQGNPFFLAWRPETYGSETTYSTFKNNPAPMNTAPHGLISMTWDLNGIDHQ